MANVILIWNPDADLPEVFDFAVFDVALQENHKGSNDVTIHPVELGVDVADHIISRPDEISLDVLMSNTPAIIGAALREDDDRAEQIYSKMLRIRDEGILVNIFTTLREYDSMALISIDVPRNVQLGNAVQMRLSFRRVQVVESEITTAPEPTTERAKPRKASGRKASKNAPLEVEDKSLSLLGKLAEAVGL